MMIKEKIIVSANSSSAIETGKNNYIEKLNFNDSTEFNDIAVTGNCILS